MNGSGIAPSQQRLESFSLRHQVRLLTLLFTDIVDSTRLKEKLGQVSAIQLIQRHHELVRTILKDFKEAQELEVAGDSFFIVFTRPSDAVRFALLLQNSLEAASREWAQPIQDRIGIHVGEVFVSGQDKSVYGLQIDTAARLMSLGGARQILLSRFAFDSARSILSAEDVPEGKSITWLNHGFYHLKGVEGPVEVCEVGFEGWAPLRPPADSEKAKRHTPGQAPVLGWRPAAEQIVPGTEWTLTKKLGESAFGEVWLGSKEGKQRVFKFCFRADFAQALKSEAALFRTLQDRVGHHPNVVLVEDVYFETPPYYIATEYVGGADLPSWCERKGGAGEASVESRLEIVAQIAEALQAAHAAGIVHRAVKPSNIFVEEQGRALTARLTDFGLSDVEIIPEKGGGGEHKEMYLAPEIFAGKNASPQSDIYSLGVIFYQLFAGGLNEPLTIDWQTKITDPLIKSDLEKCLAGQPSSRFQTAGELTTRLRTMPERRARLARQAAEQAARERAAFRRGVVRTAAVACLFFVLVSGLAVYAGLKARSEAKHRRLLEAALLRVELPQAEDMLQSGRTADGLAQLSSMVRQNPDNPLIAGRLVSALLNRTIPLPVIKPLAHEWAVITSRFNPAGDRILTASWDGSARIWDVASGKETCPPLKHTSHLRWAEFSRDGKRVVTASSDMTARVWDALSGEPITAPLKHPDEVWVARFNPAGDTIATATLDGAVQFWNVFSGRLTNSVIRHGSAVKSFDFNRDGSLLLTASDDGTGRVCSVTTGGTLLTLPHGSKVHWAEFSPDGTRILTASGDKTAGVWDAASGRIQLVLTQDAPVLCARFSPDGLRVVTGSWDGIAQVWDANTGQPLSAAMRHHAQINWVEFSPEGLRVVTASWDRTSRVWDGFTGQPLGAPIHHHDNISEAHFSPDGKTVLTAAWDNRACLWDIRPGRILPQVMRHRRPVISIQLNSTGDRVLTASSDNTARMWEVATSKELWRLDHPERPMLARFSGDGKMVLVASRAGAQLLASADGKEITPLLIHPKGLRYADLSGDGKMVATCGDDNTVRIWNVATGRQVGRPLPHADRVERVAFSADSRLVLSGSHDTTASIWDVNSGKQIITPVHHKGTVANVEFSPDGKYFLTASWDGTAGVWDGAQGKLVSGLLPHAPEITMARFSPKGTFVLTCSKDKTAQVWTRTGRALGPRLKHQGEIGAASFSGDERYAATVAADGLARIWDVATGQIAFEPIAHPKTLRCVEIRSDLRLLATGGNDSRALLWQLPETLMDWKEVAEWGEAIAGHRLTSQGTREELSGDALFHWREKTKSQPLAAWFFADRLKRPLFPGSRQTGSTYVEELLQQKDLPALFEAARMAPNDGRVLVRLAEHILEDVKNPRRVEEAAFLTRYAREKGPSSLELDGLCMDLESRIAPLRTAP